MELTQTLLDWYKRNARPFPWRVSRIDPYVVFISETMLQQTQASRVAERLPAFLEVFPSVYHLAQASNGTMLRQWQGMGYNSRALRLRDAAKSIVEVHRGVIPSDPDVLRKLPGVGPYTSAAIACFAYNKRVVVLDVNVRRVYSRLVARQTTTVETELDDLLHAFALRVIPERRSSQWHHAVMDLGATICTARKPACNACPLSELCPSAFVMQPGERKKSAEPTFRNEPQRLWRGRIIESLRGIDAGRTTTVNALCARVLGEHSSDERDWFEAVLQALEKAQQVTRSGQRIRLAD